MACFDEHVLVQMADPDVESKDSRGELVKIQRIASCQLKHAPDTLWEFFNTQSDGADLMFSFSTHVHFNLLLPGQPVAVFCFMLLLMKASNNQDKKKKEEEPKKRSL